MRQWETKEGQALPNQSQDRLFQGGALLAEGREPSGARREPSGIGFQAIHRIST